MRIRYSPRAIQNLDDIREYIHKNNPKAAWVVGMFLRKSISILKELPYCGRATDKERVRRLVVTNYPYAVYYTVVDEEVLILSVMHTAQDG